MHHPSTLVHWQPLGLGLSLLCPLDQDIHGLDLKLCLRSRVILQGLGLHTPLWTLLDTMHNSLDRQDGNPPSDCGIDWFSQLKHIAQQTRATLLAQPSQANCRGPAGLSPCTPVRWFLDRVCLCDGCSKGPCALYFFSCKF